MNIRVNGATLETLRKRYKASIEAASHMTGIDENVLAKWEKDGVELPIGDAKKIAKAYKAHWSIFLLESKVKPIEEVVNHRAGYTDNSPFSIDTLHAYEVARGVLNASKEIDGQVVEPRLLVLKQSAANNNSAPQIAKLVRSLMRISSDDILKVKSDASSVYKFWRECVSSLGIYVSEQEMPEDETKAFLIKDHERAIIVINKSDRYPFSKVFSLMHELGHVIRGENSAACKIEYANRTSTEETWCNMFASEMVALDADVLEDALVDQVKSAEDPAHIIRRLATKYRTSFTVMLYKLKRHNKVTDKQCKEMLAFFEKVILPRYKFKQKKDPTKELRLPRSFYVGKDVAKASIGLSKEIIEKQMSGALSYSDAAKLLGTKASYLEEIKHAVGYGS